MFQFSTEHILQIKEAVSLSKKSAKGKNIALILGHMGVGKSTLSSWLRGYELEYVTDEFGGDRKFIVPKDSREKKRISDKTTVGETLQAECLDFFGRNQYNFVYCDTPGFDNVAPMQSVIESLSLECVVRSAAAVKSIVIVFRYEDLRFRAGNCAKTLETLSKIVDINHLDQVASSLFFIISQINPEAINQIETLLQKSVSELNASRDKQKLDDIKEVEKNNNLIRMYTILLEKAQRNELIFMTKDVVDFNPMKERKNSEYIIDNKVKINNKINESKSIAANVFDFSRQDAHRMSFETTLSDKFIQASSDIQNYLLTRANVMILEKKIENLTATSDIEKVLDVYQKQVGNKDNKDIIDYLAKEKERCDNSIKNLKNSQADLKEEINKLKEKITDLDRDELVKVANYEFNEKRGRFFSVMSYSSCTVDQVTGYAVEKININYNKETGTFKSEANDKEKGLLKGKYYSNWGENGEFSWEMLAKKKFMPNNAKTLAASKEQLKGKENIYNENNAAIERIESHIKTLGKIESGVGSSKNIEEIRALLSQKFTPTNVVELKEAQNSIDELKNKQTKQEGTVAKNLSIYSNMEKLIDLLEIQSEPSIFFKNNIKEYRQALNLPTAGQNEAPEKPNVELKSHNPVERSEQHRQLGNIPSALSCIEEQIKFYKQENDAGLEMIKCMAYQFFYTALTESETEEKEKNLKAALQEVKKYKEQSISPDQYINTLITEILLHRKAISSDLIGSVVEPSNYLSTNKIQMLFKLTTYMSNNNYDAFERELDIYLSLHHSIDELDKKGNTLLHASLLHEKERFFLLLIAKGSSLEALNAGNKTVLSLVFGLTNSKMMTFLDVLKNQDQLSSKILLHILVGCVSKYIQNSTAQNYLSGIISYLSRKITKKLHLLNNDIFLEEIDTYPTLLDLILSCDEKLSIKLIQLCSDESKPINWKIFSKIILKVSTDIGIELLSKFTLTSKQNLLFEEISKKNVKFVQALLDKDAKVNQEEDWDVVDFKQLISAGAGTNNGMATQKLKILPIQLAIIKDSLNIFIILDNINPLPFHRYIAGNNQLHLAVAYNSLNILQYFIKKLPVNNFQPVLSKKNHDGYTPFMLAVALKHHDIMNLFIQREEKCINTLGENNQTPLHIAVKNNDDVAVNLLCTQEKLEFWLKDASDKTAYQLGQELSAQKNILEPIRGAVICYTKQYISEHVNTYLAKYPHNAVVTLFLSRLDNVINLQTYDAYREQLMEMPIDELNYILEMVAKNISRKILENYRDKEQVASLNLHGTKQPLHVIDSLISSQFDTILNRNLPRTTLYTPAFGQYAKNDNNNNDKEPVNSELMKYRAFKRALKDEIRNYFYVSRALYEGKVLHNDETFDKFKETFQSGSSVMSKVTNTANIGGVSLGFLNTAINLSITIIDKLRQNKFKSDAGRFVEAFGFCAPTAIEKHEQNIPIDHDKLKAVVKALYERYKDQIQQCTLSLEGGKNIRLATTDGIYVLVQVIARRIFKHIINAGSINSADNRPVKTIITDFFQNLGSESDVYIETKSYSLPVRCILAQIKETDGKDDAVRTDRSIAYEDIEKWKAGGILAKTGLKIENDPQRLYIRTGNDAQVSRQGIYGYCYVSSAMVKEINEIQLRNYKIAEVTEVDPYNLGTSNYTSKCSLM